MISQNSFLISLISASIGTLIVSFAFLYLYFKEKHAYLFIWFLAWIVYALRFIIFLFAEEQSNTLPLLYANQLLSLINGMLLLLGTRLFIRKGVTRSFWLLVIPSFLWFPLAAIMKADFFWLTIPTFLLLGLIFLKIGIDFIRYQPAPYFTRWGIGLTLIIWGIHKMDYPFLARNPTFAPIGFTLGFFLELTVAIGMVLLHYEMNKKSLQQAEEARLKMEQQLHQSAKLQALGQMAGGVAHDFNNQLAGIMGYAELCLDECSDSPLARDYLEQIISASKRSADLIMQLLVFARKGVLRQEVLPFHSVINDVLQMLKRSISKKIVLRTDLEAREDAVFADRSHMHNAVLNIALNGCDAMPLGGTLNLRTENDIKSKNLIITIADNGIGMTSETKSRILEPFFTTKPTGHGIGMGLPAAYGTIKKHGGDLLIESQPGKGSRFVITLPLKKKEPQSAAESNSDDKKTGEDFRGLRILVVDDESVVLSMIVRQLTRLGHHALPFNDPFLALDHFAGHFREIDLVISDLMMPGLNGFEMIMKMQDLAPELKAIISSGYGDPLDKEDYSHGDLLVIRKPFSIGVLQDSITQVIKKRSS